MAVLPPPYKHIFHDSPLSHSCVGDQDRFLECFVTKTSVCRAPVVGVSVSWIKIISKIWREVTRVSGGMNKIGGETSRCPPFSVSYDCVTVNGIVPTEELKWNIVNGDIRKELTSSMCKNGICHWGHPYIHLVCFLTLRKYWWRLRLELIWSREGSNFVVDHLIWTGLRAKAME